jgi:hypothetical protein
VEALGIQSFWIMGYRLSHKSSKLINPLKKYKQEQTVGQSANNTNFPKLKNTAL